VLTQDLFLLTHTKERKKSGGIAGTLHTTHSRTRDEGLMVLSVLQL
jgi:hypothetical protein